VPVRPDREVPRSVRDDRVFRKALAQQSHDGAEIDCAGRSPGFQVGEKVDPGSFRPVLPPCRVDGLEPPQRGRERGRARDDADVGLVDTAELGSVRVDVTSRLPVSGASSGS
jgi:hypothetical protein